MSDTKMMDVQLASGGDIKMNMFDHSGMHPGS